MDNKPPKNIGRKLGQIDMVALSADRMLIDVDTRKPLLFTEKISSLNGDEVSIKINYEKLFKYSNCLRKDHTMSNQAERTCVFARVQQIDDSTRHPFLREQRPHGRVNRYERETNNNHYTFPPSRFKNSEETEKLSLEL